MHIPKELITLMNKNRESTELENAIIRAGGYAVGEDPTKGYIVPPANPKCLTLIFHHCRMLCSNWETAWTAYALFFKEISTQTG